MSNSVEKKINKRLATAALTGILAVGAFSASPAFAGSHGNGCSAAGCGKKSEKSSCQGKSGCKSSCKAKSDCKGKSGCKSKNSCKAKNSCEGKNGCKGTCNGKKDHSDNGRYND